MNVKCKCGGTYRRSDIVGEYSTVYKRVLYRDLYTDRAEFKCDGCGGIRVQRKRQPAEGGSMNKQKVSGDYTFEVFKGLTSLPQFKLHCISREDAQMRAKNLARTLLGSGVSIRIYSPEGRALECVTLRPVVEMAP